MNSAKASPRLAIVMKCIDGMHATATHVALAQVFELFGLQVEQPTPGPVIVSRGERCVAVFLSLASGAAVPVETLQNADPVIVCSLGGANAFFSCPRLRQKCRSVASVNLVNEVLRLLHDSAPGISGGREDVRCDIECVFLPMLETVLSQLGHSRFGQLGLLGAGERILSGQATQADLRSLIEWCKRDLGALNSYCVDCRHLAQRETRFNRVVGMLTDFCSRGVSWIDGPQAASETQLFFQSLQTTLDAKRK